ncbi:MAG: amidohydrolase [Flavobacteriales bacterium]|nr:amidohydrolase [Flavobacteriales bacterium]
MRTVKLDAISFLASPEEKKFILLRNEKADRDINFLSNYAIPKILDRDSANDIQGVWGTLGYFSDEPIDWLGNFKISNDGNQDFNKESELYKEIQYIKYMYPDLDETRDIKEKVIDLRNLNFEFPRIFENDEVPKLRMDVFLDHDEGALVFYQLRRHNAKEKHIEFIQPQPTIGNSLQRDRLSYHFNIIPKKIIEVSEEVPTKYVLSDENSADDFIVKVLIFKRKLESKKIPQNSDEIIGQLEEDIERRSGNLLAKKHRLLIFDRKKNKFRKVNGRRLIDPTKKTLFLIHGTFASTKGSFGDVYDWIRSLLDEMMYEQILGYDHPTLFDDAEENTIELYKLFRKYGVSSFTKTVDVIGTSQGGLIAQYMANLKGEYMSIGKVALLASGAVDYLTFANNLSKGLKLMRKVFGALGIGQVALISGLLQHSIDWVISRKGLNMLRPGSESLNQIIYSTPISEKTKYLPIGGNYSNKEGLRGILERSIDFILGNDNDWVVSTKNQLLVPSAYCAIPNYHPGKYRKYAVTNENAKHGKLITDEEVQDDLEDFFRDAEYLENDIDGATNLDLFDAHCHLFGRSAISGRLLLMLLGDLTDYFQKNNEDTLLEPIDLRETEVGHKPTLGITIKNILKYFVFNKDAHAMLDDLEEEYYNSQTEVYRYIPLMFDLEMTFRNAYDEDDSRKQIGSHVKDFAKQQKKMTKTLNDLVKKADKGNKIFKGSLAENLDSLKILKNVVWIIKQLTNLSENLSDDTKNSFKTQIAELERLKLNYGNNIYPFLAADPRREDMGSEIGGRVGVDNVFHGIKIYSPNGYSPTDPHFMDPTYDFVAGMPLYEWCVKFNIPIMAHNSDAGFATFADKLEVHGDICIHHDDPNQPYAISYKDKEEIEFRYNIANGGFKKAVKERAVTLNHPSLWRKVLRKYPDLKICLAHFGGESERWQNEIAKLMLEYKNVYTDLSSLIDIERLKDIHKAYFTRDTPRNLKIRSRIMYGSDYFLNLLLGAKFDQYYTNFRSVFSKRDLEFMSREVPKTFLGI